ncbi:MAG TPA: 2-phospho-L-lactate guanylyltransferase [Solirubrobacterales bacterium]|jgi:2-phospho-L-lactate guanylyltransferase|nr:2-phospho-L-lactate guanylyltransferase [Solirubrobacterales bacterium]
MRATAVVPVKRFAVAKSRLAPGIEDARRPELAAAMVADVLEAIGAARLIERTIVVSQEPAAAELAATAGAELLGDFADTSHSAAALAGVARAAALGARCVALLPGDCPLLDPRELDKMLTGVPDPYVAVVPDRHGTGTNALVLAPPGAIEPSFGEGSRERHVAAARAAGVPYRVEELPSLGLDLDTPADIVALTMAVERSGGAKRTAKALGI